MTINKFPHIRNMNTTAIVICTIAIIGIFLGFQCNSPDSGSAIKQAEAIQYARINSGTNSLRNWNDEYWDNLANFLDIEEYNSTMDLNRTPELRYVDPADQWNWIDENTRMHFNTLRKELK